MNKQNSLQIKRLLGIAILSALVVVLQLLSNYITLGSISITLALIPIAMGAILYGPLAGAFLGIVMGLIVITAPSTQAVFIPANVWATIILCPLKTGVAGLVSGYIFKLFATIAKNKENKTPYYYVGIILAALVVPVINTGIFIIGASIFFQSIFNDFMGVVNAVLTFNFLLEFAISAVLSPVLVTIVKILSANYNLGFTYNFNVFYNNDSKVLKEKIAE